MYRFIKDHLPTIKTSLVLSLLSTICCAQTLKDSITLEKLKKLSMEELMDIEVTSISMRPEKLTEVASAIQVVTNENIQRSAVTRLPEALRLVSNLQIAQANSHDWAITSRGMNGLPSAGGILANKLLVMIDGRSVYNPLLGGVYWDVQNVMLEDVDRIEVVSGPGGTLWGANAVNGVINIVTKSARETKGLHVSAAAGSLLQDFAQLRYGFQAGSKMFLRVYGQRFDQLSADLSEIGSDTIKNNWYMNQGGFRMDFYPSDANTLTVQGDFYGGEANGETRLSLTDGQNILARFAHSFSEESNIRVQAYFDRTWRETPEAANPFSYELVTYDIDIQHRFQPRKRHSFLWGAGYRLQKDRASRTLNPLKRNMPLYSGFIQDEISVVPGRLKVTIGSKFLHNVFSDFEIQPSARLAWMLSERHTVWGAISRAVRTPTRFDSDITVTKNKFKSEKVIAYELGYRVRPATKLSISLATFYNRYNDLRSLDDTASTSPPKIVLANSQRAESWGIEFSGNYQAAKWWRLRGGYTYFTKDIWPTNSRVVASSESFEGVDPKNFFMVQSNMDFFSKLEVDVTGRYVDVLPMVSATIPRVPSYFSFDVRIAWQFKHVGLSIVGQNLHEERHTEVGLSRIPRSIYGKLKIQF